MPIFVERSAVLRSLDEATAQLGTWLEEAGVSAPIPAFEEDPTVHGERIETPTSR